MNRRFLCIAVVLFMTLGLTPAVAGNVTDEASGQSPDPTVAPVVDPAARAAALKQLPAGGLLLVPESTNDRVMAFDPTTGDLIDADFIASDPTNLSTPICAILSADGASILVSDQIEDVVQSYDLATGAYNGVFAPAGGLDNSILDNIRGISLAPNGNLLVTVGAGANDDAVAEFDTSGNYVGNRVANAAGGMDSPFDVFVRSTDMLVGGISSDACHRYDLSGTYLGNLASIDTFPEQISVASNGNVLIGNFSGTQEGVMEFDSGGVLIGIYDPASLGGYRGAYELPNGNILTSNGTGVHEIDRSGILIETKISGVSARFIELVTEQGAAPEPGIPVLTRYGAGLLLLLLAGIGMLLARRSGSGF